VDFARGQWRGSRVTDDELIAQLCLRIGMIMEDVCGEAVLAQSVDRADLIVTVTRLQLASLRISSLIGAVSGIIAR